MCQVKLPGSGAYISKSAWMHFHVASGWVLLLHSHEEAVEYGVGIGLASTLAYDTGPIIVHALYFHITSYFWVFLGKKWKQLFWFLLFNYILGRGVSISSADQVKKSSTLLRGLCPRNIIYYFC